MAEEVKETKEETTEEVKTYTEDELKEQLQKETDRRVSDAIKKREAKFKEELEERLKTERKEVERLAQLSEKEKEQEMSEKARKELEEREKALQKKELLSDTKDILSEEQLPTKFAEILIAEDAESTNERIKSFRTEWQKAIDAAVDERMRGKTPKAGATGKGFTREEIEKMSPEEVNKNWPQISKQMEAGKL